MIITTIKSNQTVAQIRTALLAILIMLSACGNGPSPDRTTAPTVPDQTSILPTPIPPTEVPTVTPTITPADEYWINTYTELGGGDISFLAPLRDGGVLVIRSPDIFLRLDRYGRILWARNFDGLHASGAIEMSDNKLIVIGDSSIAALDPDGQVLWWKEYDYPDDDSLRPSLPFGEVQTLQSLDDGRVLGVTKSGAILTLDQQGDLLSFQLQTGTTGSGLVTWVSEDAIFHGGYTSGAFENPWLERRGTDDYSWWVELNWHSMEVFTEVPQFVLGTHDGGVLFGAHDRSWRLAPIRIQMIRYGRRGEMFWQDTYGISPDWPVVYETEDGGFLIAGREILDRVNTPSGRGAYLGITRLLGNGAVRWSRSYGDGETLPLIRSIQETQEGDLYLIGELGYFDGEQITSSDDLLVMKLFTDGTIPGCDLFQEWPIKKSVGYGQGPIYETTPANYSFESIASELPHDDITVNLTSSDLTAEMIPICPSIEPVRTPEPKYDGAHWIIGGNGAILGAVVEGEWMPVEDRQNVPAPGTSFRLIPSSRDPSGETTREGEGSSDLHGCVRINLSEDFADLPTLALSGDWPVHFEPRQWWRSTESDIYRRIASQYLEEHGFEDINPLNFEIVIRDFNLDGVDEVVVTALYNEPDPEGGYKYGREIVLLRRVSGNEVETFRLLPPLDHEFPSGLEYQLIGSLDLNGDGDIELVIQGKIEGEREEVPETWIFEFDAEGHREALSIGCLITD